MEKRIEVSEIAKHINGFAVGMAKLLREFVAPLDPTVGEDEMAYIRRVMEAVDNVVIIATMQEDNQKAIDAMKESTDRMMQNLIELHTSKATKH